MEEESKTKSWIKSGWLAKSEREATFPLDVVKAAMAISVQDAKASMSIDRNRILNVIADRSPKELDEEPLYDEESLRKYNDVNETLRSIFAVASWRQV